MTLAMEVVYDQVIQAIDPRYIALSTLGDVGPRVCGTLELVRRTMGSYCSLVEGTLDAAGAASGVWMPTLGSAAWG